ncbi:multidrug DMT transporter permease [Glaciihabitans sp. dw_435]|uniref:multidrug DMT transporter permease n=1 Tax=Glaciihabitans sp. dw_435 TaxID=2720081 RepID=UPI0027DE92F4|nr:multidrug DMT transporter permease [Glaciihabitans sp. dw_435]
MLLDLAVPVSPISLTPSQALGIPVALVGSVFLALGAQFQHRGVGKVDAQFAASGAQKGLSMRQLGALLTRPSWVIGTLMLGLAIVLQLTSLWLAPLIVVQPLGAVALVITAVVNSRVSKVKLDRESIRAIIFCVGGVGLFVTVAAFTATSKPIAERELVTVLIILAVVLVAFSIVFATLRARFGAIFYIVGAGVLFGFVATLAKVVIDRVHTLALTGFQLNTVEWLTVLCVIALIVTSLLGSYFVQTAYSSGPPDLVVAGLTVIDPVVGVSIGVIVLGEAANAPIWAIPAFLVAGALAVYGVFQLAKHHPQTNR